MSMKGKKVLVTGGTGFIGGRLVERLVLGEQAQVRVLVRNYATAVRVARFPLEMVHGELGDKEALDKAVEGCDVVFNLAHDAGVRANLQEPLTAQATQNLCEAVLAQRVPRLVHASSLSVYGATEDGVLTEQARWSPSDHPYIRAKRASERTVLRYHKQWGLPVVVLQPTIVYGPYCKPWTIGPINSLKTGMVPLVDGGRGLCNAVYVDDVIDALLLAAVKDGVVGESFLISGEKPITWKAFYGAFEEALGTRATTEVSEAELRAVLEREAREKRFAYKVKRAMRNPKNLSRVINLPGAKTLKEGVKGVLPEDLVRKVQLRLRARPGKDRAGAPMAAGDKALHVPNKELLDLYARKTRVDIRKAGERLGYRPRYGFKEGMSLTGEYLRWAGLV